MDQLHRSDLDVFCKVLGRKMLKQFSLNSHFSDQQPHNYETVTEALNCVSQQIKTQSITGAKVEETLIITLIGKFLSL